jgi:hypothetical protein
MRKRVGRVVEEGEEESEGEGRGIILLKFAS